MWGLLFLAAEPPAAVVSWVDRITAATPQAASREPAWGPEAPAFPLCPVPQSGADGSLRGNPDTALVERWKADPVAVMQACQGLTYASFELWTEIKPQDQRAYAPLRIRVTQPPADRPAAGILAAAVAAGAVADRGGEAVLVIDGALVEVHVPCANAALLSLEVADLARSLGGKVDPMIAWSPCGREFFVLRPLTEVIEDAARPRSFFGLSFPECRAGSGGEGVAPVGP